MSRFWAGDDSGSSSAESDSGSESEQEKKVQTNRWAAVSDSDSSDEGERVVRSAKDKAWDGMKAVVSKISNARKINDWHEMQTQFDLLNKQVDKVLTAASRGLSEIIRHRRDSPPSHNEVGGLIFDSERISGEIATRYISHTGEDAHPEGGPA
jgi:HD-GYP domain-containing protein (c-di-GMP phosphodiesterase class II)